jgi:hypothetical protein
MSFSTKFNERGNEKSFRHDLEHKPLRMPQMKSLLRSARHSSSTVHPHNYRYDQVPRLPTVIRRDDKSLLPLNSGLGRKELFLVRLRFTWY